MDTNKFFQSKSFMAVILTIATIIVLLLVFMAGMYVGFKKAGFSYQWGENYHRNFAGPQQGFGGGLGGELGGKDFIDAHGTFGQIIQIDGSTLVVKDINNIEKIILVNDKTAINRFRDNIKIGDLKVDEKIVAIGDPNTSGQIEAKLIRILPDQSPLPPENGNEMPPVGNKIMPSTTVSTSS
ncbi:MAG: hypothetical protein WC244_04930 [Patescibacteria group bacterium]|jgi:hypothetical protein